MDVTQINFSNKLISWYLENKRELPWRQNKSPYSVWLSEIILQQTRVAQGLPYYEAFMEAYPTVFDLANAPQEEVLKLWQGLGYYSRARNLHETAQLIANNYDGKFPTTYTELLKLKGVGDYTASAIASICFNEPTAVVDGNVYRVLARVFGIETPINTTAGVKKFKALAQSLIDAEQPGVYNQAIMEFGATFCVPQNPSCLFCIYQDKCDAYAKNKVASLPVKLKKLKVKKKYFNFLVFLSEANKTLLEQRTSKGIWQQLYQFPLVETTVQASEKELMQSEVFQQKTNMLSYKSITKYNDTPVVHKLSHQHLYTTFWIIEVKDKLTNGVHKEQLRSYPVPVLIANFISEFSSFNTLKK